MKAAVIQLNAGSDKKKNINKALCLTEQAVRQKAKLIALPEAFNYRGPLNYNILLDVSEKIPGESVKPFLELAKKKKVLILLGSIYEKAKRSKKVYNTSLLIGGKGKPIAVYRKKHLFDAVVGNKRIKESRFFLAGKRNAAVNIKGFKMGMSICYDLRFPKLYQEYFKAGCNIIAVPSSFTKKTGEAHWETLLRARAIEGLSYILAPNQVGKDGNGIFSYGNSMIVGPWGEILARASGKKEETIFAHITKERMQLVRRTLPTFKPFAKKG